MVGGRQKGAATVLLPEDAELPGRVPRSDPGHVVIMSNRRDRAVFDLWRVNLVAREATLIAENPGDVMAWLTDWDGAPEPGCATAARGNATLRSSCSWRIASAAGWGRLRPTEESL